MPSIPQLTATLRERMYFASNDGHLDPREMTGAGRQGRQIRNPRTVPLCGREFSGAAVAGQFTLFYRVLPFSRRIVVGSLPQSRAGSAIAALRWLRVSARAGCDDAAGTLPEYQSDQGVGLRAFAPLPGSNEALRAPL